MSLFPLHPERLMMSRSTLRVGLALGMLAAPIGLLSGAKASEPVRVTAADGPDRGGEAAAGRGGCPRADLHRLRPGEHGAPRLFDRRRTNLRREHRGCGRLARARHAPRAARRRHGRLDRRHRHRGARREGARRRCPRLALGGRREDLGRADPGECGRRLRPRGPPRHGRRSRGARLLHLARPPEREDGDLRGPLEGRRGDLGTRRPGLSLAGRERLRHAATPRRRSAPTARFTSCGATR